MVQLVGIGRLVTPSRSISGTPTPAQLLSNLISAYQSCGWYAKLDCFFVGFGRADITAASTGIVGGSLSYSGTSTWTATDGYVPDGTAGSISTGIAWNLGANFLQNDAGIMTCHKVNEQNAGCVGIAGTANVNHNPRNTSDLAVFRLNAGTGGTVANTESRGTYISRRSAAGSEEAIINGVSLGTSAVASSAPSTSGAFAMGIANATRNNRAVLIIAIGAAPNDTQVAAITAANKTYCNGITPGTIP